MKLIKSDRKKGIITVKPESTDDLWSLSELIEPGDLVKGKTQRKRHFTRRISLNFRKWQRNFFKAALNEFIFKFNRPGFIRRGSDHRRGRLQAIYGNSDDFNISRQVIQICKEFRPGTALFFSN